MSSDGQPVRPGELGAKQGSCSDAISEKLLNEDALSLLGDLLGSQFAAGISMRDGRSSGLPHPMGEPPTKAPDDRVIGLGGETMGKVNSSEYSHKDTISRLACWKRISELHQLYGKAIRGGQVATRLVSV